MQLMNRFRAWREVKRNERNDRRIAVARFRLEMLLIHTPRYWRACETGGGSMIDLGLVDRDTAVDKVNAMNHAVIYIDLDQAFIALAGSDRRGESENESHS